MDMLNEHIGYISDHVRHERLLAAVAQAVKPGDTVVDVGCGSGVLGLMCLQAGAGFVHAIDSTPILEVARETFRRAGWAGQTHLIRGKSQQINLPERVDLLICDHVGYFGFDYGIVEFFTDARRRFLKPGGRLIPSRIDLKLAAIESQACLDQINKWCAPDIPPQFHWVRTHSVNSKQSANLKKQELLGDPADLGSIDFYQDQPDFFSWQVDLTMGRDGVFHGLGGWFDCELTPGIRMTNSPAAEQPIGRAQVFLPISEGVPVCQGDQVKAKVMARPGDDVIMWEVEFVSSGRKFSHSTWQGLLLSSDEIMQRSPMHVPSLSDRGKARLVVLGYCDGVRTAHQIQEAVLRDHPTLFPSAAETAHFIAQVLAGDTQ